MQYRKFGGTGIDVSALGFGAMRLPMTANGQYVDEKTSIQVVLRAMELGVNYLDTAPYYCKHESERVIGQAIRSWMASGNPRPYLSTKNPVEDRTGKTWRRWLDKSLRDMDVDFVDVYHMWSITWREYVDKIDVKHGPLEEALKAKREGLIRHLAFSFHDAAENLFKVIDTGNFEAMTVQYNLLDRSHERAIAHAHAKGMGVAIMGLVGGGRLVEPSGDIKRMQPVRAMGTPELALRFVLSNAGVSTALSGMSSVQQVEENAATAGTATPLGEAEGRQVQDTLERIKGLKELYCTGCGYCLPCPHGVNIPANFEYLNYYRVYGLRNRARELYAALGQDGVEIEGLKAEECRHCGECDGKCPQKIAIQERLEEAARLLGHSR